MDCRTRRRRRDAGALGMEDTAEVQLKLMAQSLQRHISLANELNLGLAARLLAMAEMEIKINIHGISEQELDTLCACIEQRLSTDRKPSIAPVSDLRSHDRRSRLRKIRA